MDRVKNILIVFDYDFKRIDATTAFILYLLKEYYKRATKVSFVLPTEPCDLVKENLKDVRFDYTVLKYWRSKSDKNKKHNIRIAFSIFRLAKKNKTNLIAFNFCSESTVIIVALLTMFISWRPSVVWHQHVEAHIKKGPSWLVAIKKHLSKMRLLSYCIDKICPVSEAVKRQLILKGVPERKMEIIYNGIDLSKFNGSNKSDKVLEEFQLRNMPVITTISMLIPAKGLAYLLQAVKIVKDNNIFAKFVIVGEGYLLNDLKALTSRLGISDLVYFAGRRSDVPDILIASNFLVHPSLKDALPYTILEAMAAKKAVVATSVGGIPELVDDGITGFLVPPMDHVVLAETIIRLIKNHDLASRMGLYGREKVEKRFTIDVMVKRHIELYEKCCGKGYEQKD